MISFTIYGEPVAKARPRVTRYGTYTPEKSKNYERWVQASFIKKYRNFKPLETDIEVDIKLHFEIPKRTSKKKRAEMLSGKVRPQKRPDFDNCAKAVTDALNNFAYLDDKQISKATVEKLWTDEPRVEITIKERE